MEATNGRIALQAFENRPQRVDVTFIVKFCHLLPITILSRSDLTTFPIDVSMPIMTGYESTRRIRAVETDRRAANELKLQSFSTPRPRPSSPALPFHTLGHITDPLLTVEPAFLQPTIRPSLVIALADFSSQNDQEMAFDSGIDILMTKLVRLRDVGRNLEDQVKSREEGKL